jgi:hypothetical protein
LYIRNYFPHLSLNQPERYSDQAEMRREITRLAAAGELTAHQLTYAGPGKPLEELYDTQLDPYQLNNLAVKLDQAPVLQQMRQSLDQWIREAKDLGFLPEAEWWQRIGDSDPRTAASEQKVYPLDQLIAAADLVGRPEAVDQQIRLLESAEPGMRYWAAVGLRAIGPKAVHAQSALRRALKDPSASVRIEAAGALAAQDESEVPLAILNRELGSSQPENVLHAARVLQQIGEPTRSSIAVMQETAEKARRLQSEHPLWMFVDFALSEALEQLRQ